MNSNTICPSSHTSSPQQYDRTDERRLYLSVPERQSHASIQVAPLNYKSGDRNPFNSNAGHGFNTNSFSRPNSYTGTSPLRCHAGQYDLAMLILARPNDLLVALHLANLTDCPFWGMTPNVHNSLHINNYPQGRHGHGLHVNRRVMPSDQTLSLLLGKGKATGAVDSSIHGTTDIPIQSSKLTLTDTTNAFSVSRAVIDTVRQTSNEATLTALGTKCLERRKHKVPYFDASALMDPDSAKTAHHISRGGVVEPFPDKLYRMLMEACRGGKGDVISFFPHGRSFGM